MTQENKFTIMYDLLGKTGYSVKITGGFRPQYGMTRFMVKIEK